MPTYKSPGVFVEEVPVFPPSVAEVATAIPAFIGYTEKARKTVGDDLHLVPTTIYSLTEYELLFGGGKADTIGVTLTDDGSGGFNVAVNEPGPGFMFYQAVKMFYDNGGGQCYIVSVGKYDAQGGISLGDANPGAAGLRSGLAKVELEDEPTLIVIPEAVRLSEADYGSLVQAVLLQCGKLGDRFGIFDIRAGNDDLDAGGLGTNRDLFGNNNLKYGAAYYPFTRTAFNFPVAPDESNVNVTFPAGGANAVALGTLKTTQTVIYNLVKSELGKHYMKMPPSGAVAGVYANTDRARGVWKAPANYSLADVIEPVIKLTNEKQDNLNVDATAGKSINAIRAFSGKGTLVWGARTLAGNDNEWRYVPVRRFFNMVEESVMRSTSWAVFEPNDANTWVKVRGMIENYLIDKWRDGALAGATPKDAFYVKCGLGTTMTSQDILEGRMNVVIGMAVVRPAEFIILKFSHKLQTS
jgi:phage tail sheath protein FI